MTGSPSRVMLEPGAISLLRTYGIEYPDHAVATSPNQAAEIADRLGYPVVLKVISPDVLHKSDVGGVALALEDAQSVRDACRDLLVSVRAQVPGATIEGVLVCRQAAGGLEVIVGALDDAMFGPTLMFGLGGIFTEVLKDVTFRIIPLLCKDAEEMVREIKGYPLLEGRRGQPGYDVDALVGLLLAVSQMIVERPEIEELDLNPVRVFTQGLAVLDARILKRSTKPTVTTDWGNCL